MSTVLSTVGGVGPRRTGAFALVCLGVLAFSAALAFAGPGVALAAPSVFTSQAHSRGASTAEVSGQGSGGTSWMSWAEYARVGGGSSAEALWCATGGSEGSANSAPDSQSGSGTSSVGIVLKGLSPGSEYCTRLALEEGGSRAYGGFVTFTVGAPSVQLDRLETAGSATVTASGVLVTELHVPTRYWAEYAPVNSQWCDSDGTEGSAQATPAAVQEFDSEFVGVSVDISGLTAGQSYCVALAAAVASTAHSELSGIVAGAPVGHIEELVSEGPNEVRVWVSGGSEGGEWWVEYGLASSTWCRTDGRSGAAEEDSGPPLDPSGLGYVFELTAGLRPGVEYCAAAATGNAANATEVFEPVMFTAGLPTVGEVQTWQPAGTAVKLEAGVDPAGQPTEYWFAYGPADSQWCESSGRAGSPEQLTPRSPISVVGDAGAFAETELTNLNPNSAYCAEAFAANPSGTAHGLQASFRTKLPETTSPSSPVPMLSAPPKCVISTSHHARLEFIRRRTPHRERAGALVPALAVTVTCDQAVSARLTGVLSDMLLHRRVSHVRLSGAEGTVRAGRATTLTLQEPVEALRDLRGRRGERLTVSLRGANPNGGYTAAADLSVVPFVR